MRLNHLLPLLLMLFGSPVYGWGTKEHILMTRLAAERLLEDPRTPAEMKAWLRQAQPDLRSLPAEKQFALTARIGLYPRAADGLAFWATYPDFVTLTDGSGETARKVEPFGVPERMLHFIDLEFFFPDDARRGYADDLSHKPGLSDIPRDRADPRWQRSGMLPFRIEQCYQEMVNHIRQGRLVDQPGQYPRDDQATRWAGMLAHYAEDNTQPHHATADYKSQSYFPDKLRAPNVHADMEPRLTDDENADYPALRQEWWEAFEASLATFDDPVNSDDPWVGTVEVSLASYDALPLIGHAAANAYHRDAAGWQFDADAFFHHAGTVDGQQTTVLKMKARQMAWGVKRVERLWLAAWKAGHRPPAQRPISPPP